MLMPAEQLTHKLQLPTNASDSNCAIVRLQLQLRMPADVTHRTGDILHGLYAVLNLEVLLYSL